jgi:transcriptional regulator with XRE-family HTH domain
MSFDHIMPEMNNHKPDSIVSLELLKKLRKEANLTQTQLGDLLGISQEVLSRYESGKSSIPLEIAIKLVEQLGLGYRMMVGEPHRDFGPIDPGDPYRDYLARLRILNDFIQKEEANQTESEKSDPPKSPGNESLLDGYFMIVNKFSGNCLDVKEENMQDGGSIFPFPPHGGENQQWRFLSRADGYFEILAKHSGKSLDDANRSNQDGGLVHQWTRHGAKNQQWKLIQAEDDCYFIESGVGGLCLDEAHDGNSIHLWSRHGGKNQQWRLERPSHEESPHSAKDESSGSSNDLYSLSNLQVLVKNLQQLPRLVIAGRSDAGKSHVANSLLGIEILPTDYQPLTKIPIVIVHKDYRPHFVTTDCVMLRGKFDMDVLSYESKFAKHIVQGGSMDILSQAIHTPTDERRVISGDIVGTNPDEEAADTEWAVVFADSDILRSCIIVDTPGFAASDTDSDRAVEACRGAEMLLYCSPAMGCLNQEDLFRLNLLLKMLPSPESTDGSFPLFGNFMLVITHAAPHLSEDNLSRIKHKVANRFIKHFAEDIRNRNNTILKIDDCFVTFWSELESRHRIMRERIQRLLCEDFPRYRMSVADAQISAFCQQATVANKAQIDEWMSSLNRWEESNNFLQEIDPKEPKRKEWVASRRKIIEDSIGQHESDSVGTFSSYFDDQVNPDCIEKTIREHFSNQEDAKNELAPLILKRIDDFISRDLAKRSNLISDQINEFLKDYTNMGRVNFDSRADSICIPGFDPVAAFAGGLAGLTTFGALSVWAANLGNLGGYIIAAKTVGLLACMMPTPPVVLIMTTIAAMGGPVVLAIALSILSAITLFFCFSKSWQRRMAEKICDDFLNQGMKDKWKEGIQKYWRDTLIGFQCASDNVEQDWTAKLSEWRKIVESSSKETIQKRIDALERKNNFLARLPWIRMSEEN